MFYALSVPLIMLWFYDAIWAFCVIWEMQNLP